MKQRTLSELAALCDAELEGDGEQLVVGPAPLPDAAQDEISFLGHLKYLDLLLETRAGAVLVPADMERPEGVACAFLRCADPGLAFNRIVGAFADAWHPVREGVHPTAFVDPAAELGTGVWVGPMCSVGAGARLGVGVQLLAHVAVGDAVEIGARTLVHPGVVLYPGIRVGEDCLINGGAVVGAEGFGFHPTESGWERIPQVGSVVIEDDVEVGSNCTIDRARFGATRIGRGSKLDDLVHVAHNVQIGEAAMVTAQVGIAGSATIGRRVIVGGQAGISDHVDIGAGARVGAASAVFRDVPAGTDVFGTPAADKGEALRASRRLLQLDALFREVRDLRRRLAELEDAHSENSHPQQGDLNQTEGSSR